MAEGKRKKSFRPLGASGQAPPEYPDFEEFNGGRREFLARLGLVLVGASTFAGCEVSRPASAVHDSAGVPKDRPQARIDGGALSNDTTIDTSGGVPDSPSARIEHLPYPDSAGVAGDRPLAPIDAAPPDGPSPKPDQAETTAPLDAETVPRE
jgi:hypothetical protein